MRRHADPQIQVAGRRAAAPGFAFAGDADARAVADAGGNPHVDRPRISVEPDRQPPRGAVVDVFEAELEAPVRCRVLRWRGARVRRGREPPRTSPPKPPPPPKNVWKKSENGCRRRRTSPASPLRSSSGSRRRRLAAGVHVPSEARSARAARARRPRFRTRASSRRARRTSSACRDRRGLRTPR